MAVVHRTSQPVLLVDLVVQSDGRRRVEVLRGRLERVLLHERVAQQMLAGILFHSLTFGLGLISRRDASAAKHVDSLLKRPDPLISQHLPEIAEGMGVPPQTLRGWMEGKGEPTSEEAQKILDFLKDKVGQGPEV